RIASGAVALPRLRKTAVPGTRSSGGFLPCNLTTNSRSGPSSSSRCRVTSSRPFCQVVRMVNTTMAMTTGSQPPCGSLMMLAARNRGVGGGQGGGPRRDEPQRLAPLVADDIEVQQGRDGDRAGHRYSVRVGERGRGLEREDEREDRGEQCPVDPRDVDLADLL